MEFTNGLKSLSNLSTYLLIFPISLKDLGLESYKKNPNSYNSNLFKLFSDKSIAKHILESLVKRTTNTLEPCSSYMFSIPNSSLKNILIFIIDSSKTSNQYKRLGLYRTLGSKIFHYAKEVNTSKVSVLTNFLEMKKEVYTCALVEGIILSAYSFKKYKRPHKENIDFKLEQIETIGKPFNSTYLKKAIILCESTYLARDLINMPANDCNPDYLVKTARNLSKVSDLKLEILDKSKLKKIGANLILAVNQGSDLAPYLIKLTYTPSNKNKKTKVVSLIGKGITFDTGGYSLKSPDGMIGMKCDMAGAACVLGVMQAIAKLKPKCEVRAYIPTTENMINGKAVRIGDIITALDGTTVEILNTDAEGRLILADALSLSCKDKADYTIDVATLTGACMVALGQDYAGIFSDDPKLVNLIIENGKLSGELFWQLPLALEYENQIKSKIADLKNVGNGRYAGAVTAALFLKHFVKNTHWAHLDIAGPAESDSDKDHIKTGGVGFGVRTLTRLIENIK